MPPRPFHDLLHPPSPHRPCQCHQRDSPPRLHCCRCLGFFWPSVLSGCPCLSCDRYNFSPQVRMISFYTKFYTKSFRSVQTRPSSDGFWSAPQVQWATEFSAALRPRLHPLHVHHSNLSLTSSCRCSCSPGGFFLPSKDIPSCSYFYATAQPQEWTFLLLSTLAMVSSLHFKERHFLQKKKLPSRWSRSRAGLL